MLGALSKSFINMAALGKKDDWNDLCIGSFTDSKSKNRGLKAREDVERNEMKS